MPNRDLRSQSIDRIASAAPAHHQVHLATTGTAPEWPLCHASHPLPTLQGA